MFASEGSFVGEIEEDGSGTGAKVFVSEGALVGE